MTDEIVETPEEEDTTFETEINVDGETIETVETPIYTFTFSEKQDPDYRMAYQILVWLQANMEGLEDDQENAVFGRVNTGFNENTLKSFGKKPVCDVYIDSVEYGSDFDNHIPVKVHSILIFYMKGANNQTYMKASELHDYLVQEFVTNNSFKFLDDVVKDTYIQNSGIRNQNIRGGYGVMGTFELTHELY